MPVLPVGTLFGVPAGHDLSGSGFVVMGVPFDMGYHPTRIGARSGPAHVRAHSALVAEHLDGFGVNVLTELGVIDVGDVEVLPGDVEQSFPAIRAAVSRILAAGAVPLTFGGDGAVTLPSSAPSRSIAATSPSCTSTRTPTRTRASIRTSTTTPTPSSTPSPRD